MQEIKQIVGANRSQNTLAMIPKRSVIVIAKVAVIKLNVASVVKNAQK